jgi:hypothetical protein
MRGQRGGAVGGQRRRGRACRAAPVALHDRPAAAPRQRWRPVLRDAGAALRRCGRAAAARPDKDSAALARHAAASRPLPGIASQHIGSG